MELRFCAAALLALACAVLGQGCGGGPESAPKKSDISPATTQKGASASSAAPAKKLLEPYKAPPLADLDAKADWQPQPVLDSLELMRERQSNEKPLATAQEAIALRNTSDENNAKILSALGRMPASESDVDWDATINRHLSADIKSTNPLMMSSTFEFDVQGLASFGLFGFDWNFNPFAIKATVKSWHTSKDRLYDKIVMRDDLVWSDGQPITAHDVVFSFKTILDERIPIPAVRSGADQMRWIEAYDDHTLVIFHKEALATNVWNVNFPVIPKHIYEKSINDDVTMQSSPHHVKYELNPVVGGPYRIKSRQPQQEIILERREDWYLHKGKQVRTKPYFKTIRFRVLPEVNTALLAMKSGDIDEMLLTPLPLWLTQTTGDDFYRHNTKVTGTEWTEFQFVWNVTTPYFSDKRVRQAMSYAVDYEDLLKNHLFGLAKQCSGPYHPEAWMAPKPYPQPYSRNLDKAEALLKEAGWEDHDGDGVLDKEIDGRSTPFEFEVICPSLDDRVRICTMLKDNVEQIGIRCNVRPLEFTVLQEKNRTHEFQAAFGGWGTGADPDTSENIFKTGEGRNYGEYSNPEVDKLFDEGKREFDREKRAAIYGKIHMLLWEDQPYTWLYYRNSFYAFNKQLRGYVLSPRGPFTYGPGFDNIWKAAH